MLPAFGFDYVPGDLAARLAAEQVDGPLDEVVVAYSTSGVGTSRGTRGTIGRVMRQQQCAWKDGRLVESRFGATTRKVRFPFGERTVVEWGGTEPLTVPRHTDVRNVRSYIRAPALAAQAGRFGALTAPLLRLASRFGPSGPTEQSRGKSRFAVVAEARGPGGEGRAVLTGSDVYGLTALLIVRGAEALMARRGSRNRRARSRRGLRRPHACRQARAVPHNRGLMPSGPRRTVRVVQRLRVLSEAECYARCYGWRGEDGVKVVSVEPRRPRYETPVSGEPLRSLVRRQARLQRT